MIRILPKLHPITRKRLQRFRAMRRAWWSFWILAIAYAISLASELVCNDKPLFARIDGRSFYPAFFFYSQKEVLGEGPDTRADFKKMQHSEKFQPARGDKMLFSLFAYGPYEIIDSATLPAASEVSVDFRPDPRVAAININSSNQVIRANGDVEAFLSTNSANFEEAWNLTPKIRDAISKRFANEYAPAVSDRVVESVPPEIRKLTVTVRPRLAQASLAEFKPRAEEPETIRITLRLDSELDYPRIQMTVSRSGEMTVPSPYGWSNFPERVRTSVVAKAKERFEKHVEAESLELVSRRYAVEFNKEIIRFPFHPCSGHPLGIDGSGRDVLARVLYGMRVSLTFGIVLVIAAMFVGTVIGGLQGYKGGLVDLTGQRVIEVWEAIPFLYIIILLGSIYGQSFMLLLIVEALFGWIGISYYMRGEFLRLRKAPFIEAAKTQGLGGGKIMFGHILPNALVPIITFFPFYLVGAIGLLAALDYLGFGLPPPTPSWGELLQQGQEYLWAWWLIVYPAGALFFVMLLCVFVGEGLRAAFDPKVYSKME